MAKHAAILNFNQYQEFAGNGQVPEFFINDKQIPAFAFEGMKRKFGTTYEWKLFPKEVGKTDLQYLYERCGLATNAVDVPTGKVWGKGFTLKVTDKDGKEQKNSKLEKQIWEINQTQHVKKIFQEAHQYARLYGLGIVVLGLADNQKVETEVGKPSALSYLRAFSGLEVTKLEFDKDPNSETYGQISKYKIARGGEQQQDFEVHASRVIHFNNGKGPWGKSILEPAYDLFTIYKNSIWSAGESYYQNASPLFVVSWDLEELGEPPSKEELDDIKDDIEELHVRKRYVKPKGFNLEVVKGSGQLPDPQKVIDPVVELIAGAVKVPKQLLLGTEAGALASGEVNLQQYYAQIADIQSTFAEPLLIEFYKRLQEWQILPEGNFDIEWIPLWEMDEKDRAEINKTKMLTATMAQGDAMRGRNPLMSDGEIREQILGLNPEIGMGRLPTMKTEASEETEHPLTGFSYQTLSQQLRSLTEKVRSGVSKETVLEEGKELISEFMEKSKAAARRFAEQRLGRSVSELSPEQAARFNSLEEQYVDDFMRALMDATKIEL